MPEAATGKIWMPRWLARRWRPSWKEKPRTEVLGAILHLTVYERFAMPAVLKCGKTKPYRPETLRHDDRFAALYQDLVA